MKMQGEKTFQDQGEDKRRLSPTREFCDGAFQSDPCPIFSSSHVS